MPAPSNHLYQQYKKAVLFFIILCLPVLAFSQNEKKGSIEFLKSCNGFHGIKLGSYLSAIPACKLTYMDGISQFDADSCLSYIYQDDKVLKVDSDFKLAQIGIRAYKNQIVNIYLFFDINDAYKILRDFLANYGQFNELPQEYADIYNWNTSKLNVSLKYQAKIDIGVAIFTCNELTEEIDNMKQEQRQRFLYQTVQSLASNADDINANQTAR